MPTTLNPYLLQALLMLPFSAVFITLVGLIPEPQRKKGMAVMLAFAAAVYLNGGLGIWDAVIGILVATLAYNGLVSYRFIGIGWLVHTVWDLLNFSQGHALITGDLTTNIGCAVFDTIIAVWFFLGAPSVIGMIRNRRKLTQSS